MQIIPIYLSHSAKFSIRSSDTSRSEPPQSEPQSEQRLSEAVKTTLHSGDLFPLRSLRALRALA